MLVHIDATLVPLLAVVAMVNFSASLPSTLMNRVRILLEPTYGFTTKRSIINEKETIKLTNEEINKEVIKYINETIIKSNEKIQSQ